MVSSEIKKEPKKNGFFCFGIIARQVVGGFWPVPRKGGKPMLEFISVAVTLISIIVTVIGIYEARKQNKPPRGR